MANAPSAGIPRITPLRDKSGGGRGFNVIDPGGNWIRISQHTPIVNDENGQDHSQKEASIQQSIETDQTAELLAESKGDYAGSAKLLDNALAQAESEYPMQRVPALITRAGVAITMDDKQLAQERLTAVRQISLDEADRAKLIVELEQANDFEQLLS
jgi:hypothetical protein